MAIEHDSDSVLAEAVRKAGSQSAFGRIIGKRQSTVRSWLENETPLPGEFCLKIEAVTGVSKHRLRPDVYGSEPVAARTSTPAGQTAPRVGTMDPVR